MTIWYDSDGDFMTWNRISNTLLIKSTVFTWHALFAILARQPVRNNPKMWFLACDHIELITFCNPLTIRRAKENQKVKQSSEVKNLKEMKRILYTCIIDKLQNNREIIQLPKIINWTQKNKKAPLATHTWQRTTCFFFFWDTAGSCTPHSHHIFSLPGDSIHLGGLT